MARRFYLSMLLLLSTVLVQCHSEGPSDWEAFSSKEGRFTVEMPHRPVPDPVNIRPTFVDQEKSGVWVVTYDDTLITQEVVEKLPQLFRENMDTVVEFRVKDDNGKILEKHWLENSKWPGVEVKYEVSKAGTVEICIWQILQQGGRTYSLGYQADSKGFDPSLAKRFFDSFETRPE